MNDTTCSNDWRYICQVDDIPVLGSRIVKREGSEDIALFRSSDNHVFGLIDKCPHKGGPLSAGLVHGHTVTCPLHSWNINLEDGQALAPDVGCAPRIAVRSEGGRVYLAAGEGG